MTTLFSSFPKYVVMIHRIQMSVIFHVNYENLDHTY